MKRFILKVFLAIFSSVSILLTLNMAFLKLDLTDPDFVKRYDNVPVKIKMCNFGTSHGLFAFDYSILPFKDECFNFALLGQPLFYDERIFLQYQDRIQKDTIVILPISYFNVFGVTDTKSSNFKAMNQRYYQFLEDKYIEDFALDKKILLKYYPILASSKNIVKLFTGSLITDKDNNWACWDKNAVGLDIDADAKGMAHTHVACGKDGTGKIVRNTSAIKSLRNIIRICKDKGAKPILITPPYLKEYTSYIKLNEDNYFIIFNELLSEIAAEEAIPYYDYAFDERFKNDKTLFMDCAHINRLGAKKFTSVLMTEVVKAKNDHNLNN